MDNYKKYKGKCKILAEDECKKNPKLLRDGNKIYHKKLPFNIAKEFYKDGHTIRRIGSNKLFNKIDSTIISSAFDVTQLLVTLEDTEANDWEVVEKQNGI